MADIDYMAMEMRLAHHAIKEAMNYVKEATDAYTSEHADAEVRAIKDSLDYADQKLSLAEGKLAALRDHIT